MTKRRAERYMLVQNALMEHGVTRDEVDSLLRCSRVLSTWAAHECNGEIQRDGENGDGKPYWYNTTTGRKCGRTADREAGALRRARAICERHGLMMYHQGDPRGCALYVIRPGDVPDGQSVNGYYTRGIAVCIE